MSTYFKIHISQQETNIAFSQILLYYRHKHFSFYIDTKYISWHFSINLVVSQKAADLMLTSKIFVLNKIHSIVEERKSAKHLERQKKEVEN